MLEFTYLSERDHAPVENIIHKSDTLSIQLKGLPNLQGTNDAKRLRQAHALNKHASIEKKDTAT